MLSHLDGRERGSTRPATCADIEPDNDHTDTPITMSIDWLFFLSFHDGDAVAGLALADVVGAPGFVGTGAAKAMARLTYSLLMAKTFLPPAENRNMPSLLSPKASSWLAPEPRVA